MRDATPFYEATGHEIEVFERAWRHGLPVLLKGPTGCGKTRFVQYMARRLELPLYSVACHDDLGAADLLGRHLIGADGTWWQDGPLTRAVREGGICYLDEVVEARQDTTVAIHPLADDRRELYLERTGETLQAPPSFMLVVSYNPGYQNLLKGLKPSTRQRFVALRFDYPAAQQEARILVGESGCAEALAQRLVQLGQALRRLEAARPGGSRLDPPADLRRAPHRRRHGPARGVPGGAGRTALGRSGDGGGADGHRRSPCRLIPSSGACPATWRCGSSSSPNSACSACCCWRSPAPRPGSRAVPCRPGATG